MARAAGAAGYQKRAGEGASTCPWQHEVAPTAQPGRPPRARQSSSTCPWGQESEPTVLSGRSSSVPRQALASSALPSSTCPWGESSEASGPSGRRRSGSVPRQQAQEGSDPWSGPEVARKGRRSRSNTPQDTCPWDAGSSSSLSIAGKNAQQRDINSGGGAHAQTDQFPMGSRMPPLPPQRNAPPAQFEYPQGFSLGSSSTIGEAAPRGAATAQVEYRDPESTEYGAGSKIPMCFRAYANDAPPAQRENPQGGSRVPAQSNAAPPPQPDDGVGMRSDDDKEEERMLIEKCVAAGLSEDEIMGVLEEHDFQKRMAAERTVRQSSPPEPLKANTSSIAAKRQAKAKKSLSFGPTDEEIVNVLQDHQSRGSPSPGSDSTMAPSDSSRDWEQGPSISDKRSKAKQASEATVGGFDDSKSRAAFSNSREQAAAAKNKNRMGSGIF